MAGVRVGLVTLRPGDALGKVSLAAGLVRKRLYVAVPAAAGEPVPSLQTRLASVYHEVFSAAPSVDAMVLLDPRLTPPDTSTFFGYPDEGNGAEERGLEMCSLTPPRSGAVQPLAAAEKAAEQGVKQYAHVCMGGTFDRLHIGQKLLLSMAAYKTKEGGRLFCGIAQDALFKEKALRELIEPSGKRERTVRTFLNRIKPSARYEIAPLLDGYGPSVTDPSFEAIVVTEETASGGAKCNALRAERGMSAMDVVTIGLVSPQGELKGGLEAKSKLSSTGARMRIVARLLDGGELWCKKLACPAYVVGITGGVATGKSAATDHLRHLGAEVLEADDLPGSGEEVKRAILDRMEGSKAAILFVSHSKIVENGWDDVFDELWVVVAPPKVAKERLVKRDGASAESADEAVDGQLSGLDRVEKAHVMLSNHGGEAEFGQVVDDAWRALRERSGKTLADLDGLARRWAELAGPACASAGDAAFWWREIRDRCVKPGRYYHNLDHLRDMFALVDEFKGDLERPDLVAYAVFFHDAVYDSQAKHPSNEMESARLWRRFAGAPGRNLAEADVGAVASWIERTAAHTDGVATGDLALFLDFDLAVLGRPRSSYFEYAEAISLEYSHIPFPDFVEARCKAMASFLKNPEGPYFNPKMRARFGARAVSNVQAEIDSLAATSS